MPPIAKATPRPAMAACAISGRPMRRRAFFTTPCQSRSIGPPTTDCFAALSTVSLQSPEKNYFKLVIAVRSADSLTMPTAPHQLEPNPLGLMAVKLPGILALKALVSDAQSPLRRFVSE